ncbi:MAG: succinyl-diaminopimelate desuccinylase [Magnetococcales bacterium]|nr:succinyl-diaminopimelate desuccinylase [Magnetococcales bacterium]NGZ07564.1 succinyl-diaminopimelate desuccinylase [Magnetococcales bacterium]
MSAATAELTAQLIRAPSITPLDAGCQEIVAQRLAQSGFTIHPLRFGAIKNLYARRGSSGKHLCLAGHTDVVSPGNPGQWQCDPFAGTVIDGQLIGRGVADMKGGVAAMIVGVERFLLEHPEFHHSISFLITGDEEGEATHGTVKVLEWLRERGEKIDYCLVGEPTSDQQLGDQYKNGRRGSLNGLIRFHGRQGHVAHPHLADNPIHRAMPLLARLTAWRFDAGSADFPPSSLQLTTIHAGDATTNNVIPAQLSVGFNIRFGTASTPESLEQDIRAILDEDGNYTLDLELSGLPFLTQPGELAICVVEATEEMLGITPRPSTGGGTSDARFIARDCPQTLELGLVGRTIHKVNESAPITDLEDLSRVYQRILEKLFSSDKV